MLMKNWLFSVVAMIVTAGFSFGDEFYWTGAEDAYWTNAANWKVNEVAAERCPGFVCWKQADGSVITNDYRGDKVHFGPIETENTLVNLAGRPVIAGIYFKAGAPSYTLGTEDSNEQSVCFPQSVDKKVWNFNSGNCYIVVESGVTNDQRIRAIGRGRCAIIFNQKSTSCKFYFGSLRSGVMAGWDSANNVFITDSPGEIVYDGKVTSDISGNLTVTKTGKLTWNERQTSSGSRLGTWTFSNVDGSELDLTMEPGSYVNTGCGGGGAPNHLVFNGNAHLHGGGMVLVNHYYNENSYKGDSGCISVGSGRIARIDNGIMTHPQWTVCNNLRFSGDGTLQLNSSNSIVGVTTIFKSLTVEAKRLGLKGCASTETSIANGDVVFSHFFSSYGGAATAQPQGTLAYSGDEAITCDRDLIVSNLYSKVASPRLSNRGGGKLTWTGDVLQAGDTAGADFRLEAKTADLEFRGQFEADKNWNLIIEGQGQHVVSLVPQSAVTGNVIVSNGVLEIAAGTFPNAASLALAGGALVPAAGTVEIPEVKLNANSSLIAPDGKTLSIAKLVRADGKTLSVVREGEGSVMIKDLPVGDCDWITVNGYPAKVLEGGYVYEKCATWAQAADGKWSTAANWYPALVPLANDSVRITAEGQSYSVTLENGDEGGYPNIQIGNAAADETATLSILSTNQVFGSGSVVEVNDGGVIGTFAPDANLVFNGSAEMHIGEGGSFRSMSGTNRWNATSSLLKLLGGSFVLDGTAVFCATNRTSTGYQMIFRNGTFVLKGDSIWDNFGNPDSPRIDFSPGEGEEIHASIAERARVRCNRDHAMICVGCDCNGKAYLEFNLEDSRSLSTGLDQTSAINAIRVGAGEGTPYGELNFKSGSFHYVNSAIKVGSLIQPANYDTTTDSKSYYPTGVVNQTGGTIAGSSAMAAYSSVFHGFEIGSAPSVTKPNRHFRGIYNLSDGTLSPGGMLIIGGGIRGEGDFNQTGGTSTFCNTYSHSNDSYTHPLIIGFLGGTGRFFISGGTATCNHSCYVGGAKKWSTGLWGKEHHNPPSPVANEDGSLGRGYGLLSVSGGKFTVKEDLIVGADGTGVVHIVRGNLKCRDLVFTNDCAAIYSVALSENASAPWTNEVTQTLKIFTGAKLKVDATAVTGVKSSWVKLAQANAVDGAFAADDIEFVTDGVSPGIARRFAEAEVLYCRGADSGIYLKLGGAGGVILLR